MPDGGISRNARATHLSRNKVIILLYIQDMVSLKDYRPICAFTQGLVFPTDWARHDLNQSAEGVHALRSPLAWKSTETKQSAALASVAAWK